MNITFVCPNLNLSGGMKTIVKYANFLSKNGNNVTLVCPKYPYYDFKNRLKIRLGLKPSWEPPICDIIEGDFKTIISKSPFTVNPSDIPEGDAIIATWWRTVQWVINAKESSGRKVHFVQGHETFPDQPLEEVKKAYNQDIPKIVVSTWLEDILENEYHSSHIFKSPNGVDLNDFYPTRITHKHTPHKVGFIYSPLECKGGDLAFSILDKLKIIMPTLEAEIVSTHDIPNKFTEGKEWITTHKKPSLDTLRNIYSRQSAWLFPSRSEGFGLPILESLACGTPVFSFEAGAAKDIITKDIGYIIKNYNVDEMVKKLCDYLLEEGYKRIKTINHCRFHTLAWCQKQSYNYFENNLKNIINN